MTSINENDSPEEDQIEPEPEAESQPPFEPKRIIHLSKPLTDIGEKPSWLGTIFQHKSDSDSMDDDEGDVEATPIIQPDPYSEQEEPESTPTRGDRTIPDLSDKKINPGLRLRALLSGGKKPPTQFTESESQQPAKQPGPRLIYLYIAVGVSLLANVILAIALVMMSGRINSLKTNMNGLLSGLYGNFNGMDTASISTTITVQTQVPMNFTLPIQQNTNVLLTENLAIPHAYVVINSGGLSINAPASITLPAGTNLPVALNVDVPVQISIPLTLQIPVNIPLSQTGLHQPLIGLQETVRSYYCQIDKNAQDSQGIYLCQNSDNSTPTP
ncbi:MAG: hypothetical protein ACXWNC_00410 [Anaerolineales bacterium]